MKKENPIQSADDRPTVAEILDEYVVPSYSQRILDELKWTTPTRYPAPTLKAKAKED